MTRDARPLYHPRYWLTWLGLGLWALVVQLPYGWQVVLARGLGRLAWRWAPKRRDTAMRNLALCYPEKSPQEREQMARATLRNTTLALFETGMAWFWPRWRLLRLFNIEGLEHLRSARDQNQGVLLLGMHFTNLDLGAKFVCLHHSIDGLYRPHNNPVYDRVQRWGRERHSGGIAIAREDLRFMLKRLREGRVAWYAPDQDYGAKRPHLFAPFFGVPAATVTSTAQLARAGRAQVIPFTHTRLSDKGRYQVTLYPPLTDFPSGDEQADAERINRFVEARVRECPEQYLWVHRRFKTRPPGEPPLYQ